MRHVRGKIIDLEKSYRLWRLLVVLALCVCVFSLEYKLSLFIYYIVLSIGKAADRFVICNFILLSYIKVVVILFFRDGKNAIWFE